MNPAPGPATEPIGIRPTRLGEARIIRGLKHLVLAAGLAAGAVMVAGPANAQYWYADPYWYPEPYLAPVYAYPAYVPPPVVVAPPPPVARGAPPAQFWYYCDNPQGYYPYITSCSSAWRPVPAPSAAATAAPKAQSK